MAQPSNPGLWEKCKLKARATDEGTPRGRWGARKMVLARRDYQRNGGKWVERNMNARIRGLKR